MKDTNSVIDIANKISAKTIVDIKNTISVFDVCCLLWGLSYKTFW